MKRDRTEALKWYSQTIQSALAERFPSLADGWKEQSDGSLSFEMKRPSGGSFWISTAHFELTVGFEFPHRHFGTNWDPDLVDPLEDVAEAEEFVKQMLEGKYVAATWRRPNGKYVQSMLLEVGEDPKSVQQGWFSRWRTKGCLIEVVRWD